MMLTVTVMLACPVAAAYGSGDDAATSSLTPQAA